MVGVRGLYNQMVENQPSQRAQALGALWWSSRVYSTPLLNDFMCDLCVCVVDTISAVYFTVE